MNTEAARSFSRLLVLPGDAPSEDLRYTPHSLQSWLCVTDCNDVAPE